MITDLNTYMAQDLARYLPDFFLDFFLPVSAANSVTDTIQAAKLPEGILAAATPRGRPPPTTQGRGVLTKTAGDK